MEDESEYFRMHLYPGFTQVSEFFKVQNGDQIDIHYHARRDGEDTRELIAYSNVPQNEVDALVAAGNQRFRDENTTKQV